MPILSPKIPNRPSRAMFLASLTLVTVAAVFLCCFRIGQQSIRYSDESYHTRVIQEMRLNQDYRHLTMLGVPYYNKPPFKMWLSLVPLNLFGERNFSYRIIDGLAGAGTVVLTFLLAYSFSGSLLAGLFSSGLLLSSTSFLIDSRIREATQDSMLVFLVALSMFVAWKIIEWISYDSNTPNRKAGLFTITFGLLVGLGMLTKSAAGFLPVPIFFVALLCTNTLKPMFQIYWKYILASALVAIVLPASYYLPLFISDPRALGSIIGYDLVDRLVTKGFHNKNSWDLYLNHIFLKGKLLPKYLVWLAMLWAAYNYKKNYVRFALVWLIVPLIGYSCLHSRIPRYIAPMFPSVAILSGLFCASAISCIKEHLSDIRAMRPTAVLWALALAVLLVLVTKDIALGLNRNYIKVSDLSNKLPMEVEMRRVRDLLTNSNAAPGSFMLYKLGWDLNKGAKLQGLRNSHYVGYLRREGQASSSLDQVIKWSKEPGVKVLLTTVEHEGEIKKATTPCLENRLHGDSFLKKERRPRIRWVVFQYNQCS